MAAINAIAKDWADELRDGIAWVIVWKTGRSWNATAVWLNSEDDTFEPEDLEQARKILAQDPNAVMLNGYYCGHFGEDMTVAELAAGIRWHYENGYNLLDGSTAFPPEPMERPADLPASLPWYGKATSTEPDPYVYDGYMSPEDFELMHKNMGADRQREKSPPEGPTAELTLTFTPETAAALLEAITPPLLRAVQYAAEVARKAWDAFMEMVRKTAATVAKLAGKFVDAMLCTANDHPKWWHYYKHAKKWRVRKKYKRRLERQLYDKLLAAASG